MLRESGLSLYGASNGKALLKRLSQQQTGRTTRIQNLIAKYLQQAKPGDYVAVLAYLAPSPARDRWLKRLRACLRDALRVATSASYGPRYLHSTGQFHKGGPPKGLLLEITAEPRRDLLIPCMSYSFGQLELAQAQGDLEALQVRQRPILRLHLEANTDQGLGESVRRIERELSKTGSSVEKRRRVIRRLRTPSTS